MMLVVLLLCCLYYPLSLLTRNKATLLAFTVIASTVSHRAYSSKSSCSPNETSGWYRSTQDLLDLLQDIAHNCRDAHARWIWVRSKQGSNILSSGSTDGKLLSIMITRNAEARARARRHGLNVPHRTTVVAVFGEHAREKITSELALHILRRYCTSDRRIDRGIELHLIPVANEGGRRYMERGDACHRLNRNGVDINRNYDWYWGRTDSSTMASEENAGRHAFSEFESRAIDALVCDMHADAYISVHSGEKAVLYPWDSGIGRVVGEGIKGIATAIRDRHCNGCWVGTAGEVFGYRAYGSGVDYMFGKRGVGFACTVEIWGGSGGCDCMFNALTREGYDEVMRNWSTVLETVAENVAKNVAKSVGMGCVDAGNVEFLAIGERNKDMLQGYKTMSVGLFCLFCVMMGLMWRRYYYLYRIRRRGHR